MLHRCPLYNILSSSLVCYKYLLLSSHLFSPALLNYPLFHPTASPLRKMMWKDQKDSARHGHKNRISFLFLIFIRGWKPYNYIPRKKSLSMEISMVLNLSSDLSMKGDSSGSRTSPMINIYGNYSIIC